MSRAHQHPAGLGHQREDMPRLDEVFRPGFRINRSLNRAGPVRGRDTSGNALRRFDGYGEVGSGKLIIHINHQRQTQLLTMVLGQRQADQSTAVLGHEVDGVRRYLVSRNQQVTFIFTVFIIHNDDHSALPQLFNNFFGCIQCLNNLMSLANREF